MIIVLQIVNRLRTIKYQYNPIQNNFFFFYAGYHLLKNPTKITHHSGGWDVSPQPFRRQPFRHGDVSPRPFRRHLNLITAVMINSIFTEYAIQISRNFNFILDHQSVYRSFYLYICILYLTPNIAHT
jgi:hypothetical protein